MFDNIDLNAFWDKKEHGYLESEPFSEETLREIEKDIGYRFPQSYIALMRVQNGGRPYNTSVGYTGWEIGGIYGISIDIIEKYKFWTEEIGCPKEFVPVCTSAYDGDRIFLDYRKCGNDGEPRIVGIDTDDNTISFIAKDFESFINMLSPVNDEDDDETVGEDIDPYEGVQFNPVEGEQRKKLDRVIWDALPWGIGFTLFWLLVLFVLYFFKQKSIIIAFIWVLSNFPELYGIIGTIACLSDCISKSKQTYESYVDTVDVVWETNEPIHKKKADNKKRKSFLRLKNSKVESYPNTERFQEGDRVRVYKAKNGKVILAKEQG